MLVLTLIFFCLSNSKFLLELNRKEDPDVVKGIHVYGCLLVREVMNNKKYRSGPI